MDKFKLSRQPDKSKLQGYKPGTEHGKRLVAMMEADFHRRKELEKEFMYPLKGYGKKHEELDKMSAIDIDRSENLEAMMKEREDHNKREKYPPDQHLEDLERYKKIIQDYNTEKVEKLSNKIGSELYYYSDITREYDKVHHCRQMQREFNALQRYLEKGIESRKDIKPIWDTWKRIKKLQEDIRVLDAIDIREEIGLESKEQKEIRTKKMEIIGKLSSRDLSNIADNRTHRRKDLNIANPCKYLHTLLESLADPQSSGNFSVAEACKNLDNLKNALANKTEIISDSHMQAFTKIEEDLERKIKEAYQQMETNPGKQETKEQPSRVLSPQEIDCLKEVVKRVAPRYIYSLNVNNRSNNEYWDMIQERSQKILCKDTMQENWRQDIQDLKDIMNKHTYAKKLYDELYLDDLLSATPVSRNITYQNDKKLLESKTQIKDAKKNARAEADKYINQSISSVETRFSQLSSNKRQEILKHIKDVISEKFTDQNWTYENRIISQGDDTSQQMSRAHFTEQIKLMRYFQQSNWAEGHENAVLRAYLHMQKAFTDNFYDEDIKGNITGKYGFKFDIIENLGEK